MVARLIPVAASRPASAYRTDATSVPASTRACVHHPHRRGCRFSSRLSFACVHAVQHGTRGRREPHAGVAAAQSARRPRRRPTLSRRRRAEDVRPAARAITRSSSRRSRWSSIRSPSTSMPTAACGCSRCRASCPSRTALNSREPINDVVVLEDTNGDGVMDKRTVFADKLVLPRALKVLGSRRARRRAAEPLADEGHRRRSQGRHQGPRQQHLRPRRGQHRAQREQPVLGARQHDLHVRARLAPALEERQVRDRPDAEPRPVGRDAGRCRAHLPERQRRAAVRRLRRRALLHAQPEPGAHARPLRSADRARGLDRLADARDARREPRLPRSVLPPRRQLRDDPGRRHARSSTAAIDCRRSCTATRSSPTRRPTWCTATRSWTTAPAG